MVYVHQVYDEVQVKNELVHLLNINQKIQLILYVNYNIKNLIYLLFKNRILNVYYLHLFYVKQHHHQMQRISFHINLVIIPHLIMIKI
jgi:hypothetical protein